MVPTSFSLTDIVPPAIAEGDNYSLSFDGEDDYGQIEYFEGRYFRRLHMDV